jgi:hypothetical protein
MKNEYPKIHFLLFQPLSKFETALLKSRSMKPEKSILFYGVKKSSSTMSNMALSALASTASVSLSTTVTSESVSATSTLGHMNSDAESNQTALVPRKPAPVVNACEGIFPDYRKKKFQDRVNAFVLYATIPDTAMYSSGVGSLNNTNMFHRSCTGMGMIRYTKIGNIHACDTCHVEFYVSLDMCVFESKCLNPLNPKLHLSYSDEWSKSKISEAEHV